jgi:hypothetical protein
MRVMKRRFRCSRSEPKKGWPKQGGIGLDSARLFMPMAVFFSIRNSPNQGLREKAEEPAGRSECRKPL